MSEDIQGNEFFDKRDASLAYSGALQDRLTRARAEVAHRVTLAVNVRSNRDIAIEQADIAKKELAELRSRWTAEQPQREALLKRTGEAERQLAEREKKCAEALAAHAAELSRDGVRAEREETAGIVGKTLEEHRFRLAQLQNRRLELTSSLQDLRDASRHEASALTQLVHRPETLRREIRSLKAAAEAVQESEAGAQRKLDSLDSTVSASHQRQRALERSVSELRSEVQRLRAGLATAVSAANAREATAEDADAVTRANNLRLQVKIAGLRSQLAEKQNLVRQLRHDKVVASVAERQP